MYLEISKNLDFRFFLFFIEQNQFFSVVLFRISFCFKSIEFDSSEYLENGEFFFGARNL